MYWAWCSQPYSLGMLEEKLKAMYKCVTEGKFSEALRQVNVLLALIPLTIVDTRREVDEVKELISIARCAARLGPSLERASVGTAAKLHVAPIYGGCCVSSIQFLGMCILPVM